MRMEKVYEVYINPENTRIVLRGCEYYDEQWCDLTDDFIPLERELWAEIYCINYKHDKYYGEREEGVFESIADINNLIESEMIKYIDADGFLEIQTNKGRCKIKAIGIGGNNLTCEVSIEEYNIHYTDALLEKMNMRKITTDF